MPVISQRFSLRRGTAADWTAANPVLASGEEGYESDTRKRKVGDGTKTWTQLGYDVADSATPVDLTKVVTGSIDTVRVAGGAFHFFNSLTDPGTNAQANDLWLGDEVIA